MHNINATIKQHIRGACFASISSIVSPYNPITDIAYYVWNFEPWGQPTVGNEGYSKTAAGTGVIQVGGLGRGIQATSGPNAISSILLTSYIRQLSAISAIHKVKRMEMILGLNLTATWNVLLTDTDSGGAYNATARHIGLKGAFSGLIYFTTADGTAEQTTDVSAFIVESQTAVYVITFDGTTATLYINGTIRATHTVRVPIAGGPTTCLASIYVSNTGAGAVAKTVWLDQLRAIFAI